MRHRYAVVVGSTHDWAVLPSGYLWGSVTFTARAEALAVGRAVVRHLRRSRVLLVSVVPAGAHLWRVRRSVPVAVA